MSWIKRRDTDLWRRERLQPMRVNAVLLGAAILASAPSSAVQAPPAPRASFTVVHTYPHDPSAFTQGLEYEDGFLYEGTGLNGRSSIRKVKIETGEVVQQRALAAQY